MKKDVRILRVDDLMALLDAVEENLGSIEPPQTEQFLDGMRSGLNIGRKLAEKIGYEAYEYDMHATKTNPTA